MANPPRPKKVSIKTVAKTYKRNTKTSKVDWNGAAVANADQARIGIGSTKSKNTYKPKAMGVTLGGTRNGKGATIKKIGKV